ncbi:class IV adenylate cyclase [Patescibacteria group bacterium]|nr:class IV adenylate cyclase [Patescibacteria group bacterium]
MKEIEVKFKVKNFRNIIPKLNKLGARLVWQGLEQNVFFDFPAGKLKKQGVVLRLRKWPGHSNLLTLKTGGGQSSKKYNVRDEYQIKIDDIKSTKEILKNLGLVECFYYKKFRQHWTLGKTAIELDKLRHIYFVEIEAPKKEINELAKILGLDWKQSNTKNYLEILKELKL